MVQSLVIPALIKGVLLGFAISCSAGPAAFSVIQTGIQRGKWYGVAMSVGILLSDITLISICLLGLSSFINQPKYKLYFGIISGIILILYGINTFLTKPKDPNEKEQEFRQKQKSMNILKKYMGPNASWPVYLFKGYLINILNPFILIFWLTAVGTVGATASDNEMLYSIVFFSGTLSVIFSCDILKAYLGYKIKSFINYKVSKNINKLVGAILSICGIVLIIKTFII